LLVDGLEDERWHARRNMLTLLSHFEDLPEDFTPAPYLVDSDPRVRRAAMKLGLAAWSEVETVMVAALEDSDPQIVELGIEAAKQKCPPLVVSYIETIALDEKAASPIRVGAIQALASSGAPSALPTLMKLSWVRKFFLIKGLADKSSELMAALAAINERWGEDHAAARVLRAARKSKDPQIKAVAKAKGGTE